MENSKPYFAQFFVNPDIQMITIFSATNRSDSNTELIARNYRKLAEDQGFEARVYSFCDLPGDFLLAENYGDSPESFSQVLKEMIQPVDRFVFIIPEYNGSYPGVTKLFLDTIKPSVWQGKKAALVGVATGRAGNLRGMDHLAAVLNYLKMEVYSQKIPLSSVHQHLNESGKIALEEYNDLLSQQIKGFLKF
ncbi:NAD(P)H-dependent oxidoreductase [Cryomorphaceae bacterium 1068]|nr:NAD(P)H-dependent oxidoreductase [Cryomorphaceae bacterium 1068]